MSSKLLDTYIVLKTIGLGRFSKVKAVLCPDTSTLYAAKIFLHDLLNPTAIHEATIMQTLRGPGVVQIFHTNLNGLYQKPNGTQKRCIYILMELCTNGDLFDLATTRTKLSLPLTKVIFHQILSAVQLCHNQNVFHRDLKPENILFTSNFEVKLTDFGSAFIEGQEPIDRLLPSKFTAPEVYKGEYRGDLSDVFSLGVILFYLVTGNPPFHAVDVCDGFYRSFVEEPEMFWKKHSGRRAENVFSNEFKDLVQGMMNPNPGARFGISEVLQHSWLAGESFDLDMLRAEISQRRKEVIEEIKARKEIRTARNLRTRNQRSEVEIDSLSISFNEVTCKKFRSECFLNKFTQVRSWLDKKTLVNEVQAFLEKKLGFNIEVNEFSQVKVNIVTDLESLDVKVTVYEMEECSLVSFKLLKGCNFEMVEIVKEFVQGLEKFNN